MNGSAAMPPVQILRQVVENAHEGIWIIDTEAKTTYVNKRMAEILGCDRQEVVGHSVYEFVSRSNVEEWRSHLLRRQAGVAEDYEVKFEKKDGTSVWTAVSATPLFGEDGKWIGSAGMVRDIEVTRDTTRFLAEREKALQQGTANLEQTILERTQELTQSRAFVDSLIENLPNMVFVKEAKSLRFVRFNRAGEELLGYDRSQLIGKNDYDFFPKDQADFFTSKDRAVLAGREIVNIPEEPIATRVLGERILHTKKIPVFGKDGNPEYLLGIAEDITEWKKADVERLRVNLEQAAVVERERAAREFLTIASHELKTPVTSLRIQLQMAIRNLIRTGRLPRKEKLLKVLESSTSQVDRLTRLIEDLLDVSRMQSGKLSFHIERVNLSRLLIDVLDRYREPLEASQCDLRIEVEDDVYAFVDHGRIEQVIVNLISNVLKYAPGAPLSIVLKKIGDRARIEVIDRGPGIEARQLERIFERFGRATSSRNIGGLGLGLFISKQIVEAHGGKIQVESKIGQGSKFIILLPLRPTNRPVVDKYTYTAETCPIERGDGDDSQPGR